MSGALPVTPEENAARVDAAVNRLAVGLTRRPLFLVDGDRTLSPDDTSRTFLGLAGLDPSIVKRRFQRDGYVFDAFRFHTEYHVGLGERAFDDLAPRVASQARLHPGAAEFLAAAVSSGQVVIVSAGIPRIWRAIADGLGLPEVRVIGGIDPAEPFVFGRSDKARVVDLLGRLASRVVAVGDSDVDTEMLRRADAAVVVVNHRRNEDLLPAVAGHPSLWQVVPEGEPHHGIPALTFPEVAGLANGIPETPREVRACP